MKIYKLTDENGKTRNDTQWAKGTTHTADGYSTELCNRHWIHAYQDALLAVLMNPAHGSFKNPILWECEGTVGLTMSDKIGCTSLTTLRKIPLPTVTTKQRCKFALLVALAVYPLWKKYDKDGNWKRWADNPTTAACAAAYAAACARAANITLNLVTLAHAACSK